MMPWIHIEDLCNLFVYAIENELTGTYNAAANCDSNHDFMKALAKALKRPFFMPKVPAFLLKLILGEMSTLVLDSTNASNEKIKNTGFVFQYENIQSTLNALFKR
jgi:NAD dependent epimerase/dehydratase family enzyme